MPRLPRDKLPLPPKPFPQPDPAPWTPLLLAAPHPTSRQSPKEASMPLKPLKPSKQSRNQRKSEQRRQSQVEHQLLKDALARKAASNPQQLQA